MNEKRIPLKNGTILYSKRYAYEIEKKIAQGGSSIIYLASMYALSSSEFTSGSLVLIKEAYPSGIDSKRTDMQSIDILMNEQPLLIRAQSMLKKEYDLYRFLQENESELLRKHYGAVDSMGKNHISTFQPLDFLMEAIEFFHSEQTMTSYFAMKTYEGITLRGYANRLQTSSLQDILSLFCKITEAVEFLHRKNVLHLDLKPDNIFITNTGSVKLIDLNAACFLSESSSFTAVTQGFSPIEAYGCQTKPDQTADTFTLSAILNWLLMQNGQIKQSVVSSPLDLFLQDIPCLYGVSFHSIDKLQRILKMGLSTLKNHRYATALDLLNEIASINPALIEIDQQNGSDYIKNVIGEIVNHAHKKSAGHFIKVLNDKLSLFITSGFSLTVDETADILTMIDVKYYFPSKYDFAYLACEIIDSLHTKNPIAFPLRDSDEVRLLKRLYSCATHIALEREKVKIYEERLSTAPLCSVAEDVETYNALLTKCEENFCFQQAFVAGEFLWNCLQEECERSVDMSSFPLPINRQRAKSNQALNEVKSKILSKMAQQLAYQGRYEEAKEYFSLALNIPVKEENRKLTISYAFHAAVSAMLSNGMWHDSQLFEWTQEQYSLCFYPNFKKQEWYMEAWRTIAKSSMTTNNLYSIYGFLKALWALQASSMHIINPNWFEEIIPDLMERIKEADQRYPSVMIIKYCFLLAKRMNLYEYVKMLQVQLNYLGKSKPDGVAGILVAAVQTVCLEDEWDWERTTLYTWLKKECMKNASIKEYFQDALTYKATTLSLLNYLYD